MDNTLLERTFSNLSTALLADAYVRLQILCVLPYRAYVRWCLGCVL